MKDSTFIKIGIIFLIIGVGAFLLVTTPWKNFSSQSDTPENNTKKESVIIVPPERTQIPSPAPQIEAVQPEETTPEKNLQQAKNFITQGNFSQALEQINQYKKQYPNSIPAMQISIDAYMGSMNFIEAEREINALLQQQNTPQNQVKKVEILLLSGKAMQAKTLIETLPQSEEKIFYQMIIAVLEEDNKTVARLAHELVDNKTVYASTAQNFLDVFETYKSFRDGSPHYLRTMMANILNILDYHALTIQFIKPTLEAYPDYRDAWIIIGNSYLSLKKYSLAEEMLDKAISLDPAHPQSPFFLGITLSEMKQFSAAREQFMNALHNGYTPRAKANRYIADSYAREKKYDKAVEYYQNAISDTPNSIERDFIDSITISISQLHSPDIALNTAEEMNRKFPESSYSLPFLGWSQMEMGYLEKAEKTLQKALIKNPHFAPTSLIVGQLYEKKSQNEQALDAYKKGYQLGKGNAISRECAQRYNDLKNKLSAQ